MLIWRCYDCRSHCSSRRVQTHHLRHRGTLLSLQSTLSHRNLLMDPCRFKSIRFSFEPQTSTCSAAEKEKMAAIWRDLFRVILNMPVHHMFDVGQVGYAASSGVASGSWPVGTRVLTSYGVGQVIAFNDKTKMHEVSSAYINLSWSGFICTLIGVRSSCLLARVICPWIPSSELNPSLRRHWM